MITTAPKMSGIAHFEHAFENAPELVPSKDEGVAASEDWFDELDSGISPPTDDPPSGTARPVVIVRCDILDSAVGDIGKLVIAGVVAAENGCDTAVLVGGGPMEMVRVGRATPASAHVFSKPVYRDPHRSSQRSPNREAYRSRSPATGRLGLDPGSE